MVSLNLSRRDESVDTNFVSVRRLVLAGRLEADQPGEAADQARLVESPAVPVISR